MWIAIDDCSGEDSGTLEYAPGSHLWPVPYDDEAVQDNNLAFGYTPYLYDKKWKTLKFEEALAFRHECESKSGG